jgi:uncharacterized protein involved in exopolysaccharide biosynthesis
MQLANNSGESLYLAGGMATMNRVLELIFSRLVLLLMLLAVPLLIAVGIMYLQPRQYEASATLIALRRYEVVGATGPESDLTATPAVTQAAAITEILQTQSVALAIAHASNLASNYSVSEQANQAQLDVDMFNDISAHVLVVASGPNVVTITYDNKKPKMAQAVVQAVVTQYGSFSAAFATNEAQQLLLIYQEQLQQAQDASTQANNAQTNYLRDHPFATEAKDPYLNALAATAQNDLATVGTVQGQIDGIKNEMATIGVGSNTLFAVVDQPKTATNPISRSKTLIEGVVIGLVVGLLACILFVIIMMRRDRTIYSVADLQRITEAPVLLQIPQMPPRVVAQTMDRLDSGGLLL